MDMPMREFCNNDPDRRLTKALWRTRNAEVRGSNPRGGSRQNGHFGHLVLVI